MIWHALVDPAFSGRLCLTLLYSVWQAALLALIAWCAGWVWRSRSVERCYAVSVVALLATLTAMPVTYLLMDVTERPNVAVIESPTPTTVTESEPTAIPTRPVEAELVARAAPDAMVSPPKTDAQTPASFVASSLAESPVGSSPWWWLLSPWIAALYTAGVALMLARLVVAAVSANRLGTHADAVTDGPLVEALRSLARQWSIRVVPTLARAEEIVVPKVIGLARPTILLPASAISGLSTGELEMIVAHELAHVRRYDMWVNLLQRLAEAVLFFNPALWYLSHRISTLREYCCDEITCGAQSGSAAASAIEPRVRYARALLRVIELATPKAAASADLASLAASGRSPSEIRRRVARLFGEPLRQPLGLSRGGVLTLTVMAALLVMGPSTWQSVADSAAARPSAMVAEGASRNAQKPATEKSSPDPTEPADGIKTIRGKVFDEAGNPLADAHLWRSIYCKSLRGRPRVQHVKTDLQGRFTLEIPPAAWLADRLPEAPVAVWAYAPGYQLGVDHGESTMSVSPGEDASVREICLRPAADTSFVILDPAGQPLADALVQPYYITFEPTPGEVLRHIEARTDAAGRAKLPAVGRDGLNKVRVNAKGFGVQIQRYSAPDRPLPAENTISLRSMGRIEGRVVADSPEWARGIRMALETCVFSRGATSPRWVTDGFALTESDDQGRFTATIAAGRLRFAYLHVDDKLPVRPQFPRLVDVQANATTELVVPMTPLVPVRGSVRLKDRDTPVSGVEIELRYGEGGQQFVPAVSDPQGRFTAQVLPGSVRLLVHDRSEKYVHVSGVSYDVPNQPDEFTLPPLEVVPTKRIAGRVVDERQRPVAHATVSIVVANRSYSGKSDVNGRFELVGVPAPVDTATAEYEVRPNGVPRWKVWPDSAVSRRKRLNAEVFKTEPLTIRVQIHDDPRALQAAKKLAEAMATLQRAGAKFIFSTGDDGVRTLTSATLPASTTDADIEHFKEARDLTSLYLNNTRITDAGLKHLAGLTELRTVYLYGTRVTAKGVAELGRALPNCDVRW